MSFVQPAGFTALQFLKQGRLGLARNEPGAVDLIAVANGVELAESGVSGVEDADALYSVHSADAKLKIHLMERLGEEFGFSLDDFEHAADFGRAVKNVLEELKLKIHLMGQPGGKLSLDEFVQAANFGKATKDAIEALELGGEDGWRLLRAEIERIIGIDELGISLEDFVNAIIDPKSYEGRFLETLLRREVGEEGRPRFDDIGRYGQ